MSTFAALGVSAPVCAALQRRGITTPFAIQSLVVADVLAGRDVLAQSPTGSGKTLAFMVPLAERIDPSDAAPAALILAPTRELAAQIVDESAAVVRARGLKVAAVYGGVGITKQARDAARAHVVVATPGRLEDLLARRAFTLDAVQVLVLDEADRMLDMGFRPAIDRIVRACPKRRQTLFFSATLEGAPGDAATTYTRDAVRHAHAPTVKSTAAIEHRFVHVERDDRIDALKRVLAAERDLALVFVRTKRGADRLAKKLDREGVRAAAMHGDKSQSQRERALSRFEQGAVDLLIATDVAARGIDVDAITHVIHFDPPGDADTYTHRTGRTGRAGRTGVGVTFVGREHAKDVEAIARELGLATQFATTGLARLAPKAVRPAHGAPQHTSQGQPRGRRRRRPAAAR